MHANRPWPLFLGILTAITLFYTFQAGKKIVPYYLRTEHAVAEKVSWSVARLGEGKFAPQAHYGFEHDGKRYRTTSLLKRQTYANPWGIEREGKNFFNKEWIVWYRASDPRNHSLERTFPWKETLSLATLWVLLIYFFGLGYYVSKGR